MSLPIPENEENRLRVLQSYGILDTETEEEFNALTELVAELIGVPISLITLIDKDRQWFKSTVGIDATETPREISFCQYAIMQNKVYEVEDALNSELFANNPFVTGEPNIRFYAGAPLTTSEGYNLGTLCVLDDKPRTLTEEQRAVLVEYAKQVVWLIESRKESM